MQVLVLSSGRSGTNLVLTILSNNKDFILSNPLENKQIFLLVGAVYIDNYLCKSDTTYIKSWIFVDQLLQNNPEMKIIWTIRNPFDWALSKINRGHKEIFSADDADYFGCVSDLFWAAAIHRKLIMYYSNMIYTIRMEDILLDTENTIKLLCNWLNIEYKDRMRYFYKDMKFEEKAKRYNKIDLSQIDMWKDNNYMKKIRNKSGIDLCKLFESLQPLVEYYKY